jgi:chromosome segregation ATPase
MGLGTWLRQTFHPTGRPIRPHRHPTVLERLRTKAKDLEQRLQAVSQERDIAKVRVGQLERQVKELDETKHEQGIEIRKLQGDLEVESEQVKRQAEVLVYLETLVKSATARASVDIARATQGVGGRFDAQYLDGRS